MPAITQALIDGHARLRVKLDVRDSLRTALATSGMSAPTPLEEEAMIDTGASITCIDREVVQRLGLLPVTKEEVRTPNGPPAGEQWDVYYLSLRIENAAGDFWRPAIRAVEAAIAHTGVKVLLGSEALENCVFLYDRRGHVFSLEW